MIEHENLIHANKHSSAGRPRSSSKFWNSIAKTKQWKNLKAFFSYLGNLEARSRYAVERILKKISVWFKFFIGLLIIWYLYVRISDDSYVISKIEIPERLLKEGIDSEMIQSLILQNIKDIKAQSNYIDNENGLTIKSADKTDYSIEVQGISLNPETWLPLNQKKILTRIFVDAGNKLNMSIIMDSLSTEFASTDSLSDDQCVKLFAYKAAKDILTNISPIGIALYQLNLEDYDGARAAGEILLEKTLEKKEKSIVCHIIAICYNQLGNKKEAINFYKKALDYSIKNTNARMGLCQTLINSRDSRLALQELKELEKYLKTDSNSKATFYNLKGNYYTEKGNYSLARDNYRDAISYKPTFFEANFNLARASASLEEYRLAAKYMDLAMKYGASENLNLDPRVWGFWTDSLSMKVRKSNSFRNGKSFKYINYPLAYQAFYSKNYDVAKKYFENSLARDGKLVHALYMLGRINQIQGNSLQAISNFQKANRVLPNNVFIVSQLALSYASNSDFESANECATSLLKIKKYTPIGFFLLYSIEVFKTDPTPRRNYYFESGMAINPNNISLLEGYLELKLLNEEFQSASNLSHKLLGLEPDNKLALQSLITLNEKTGNYQQAKLLRKEIINSKTKNFSITEIFAMMAELNR